MTATAFLEQSQTFKVLKEQKSPKAKGSRVHLDGGGCGGVCVSKCMKVQKMPFFTSFFTLRAGVIHSCLTRS